MWILFYRSKDENYSRCLECNKTYFLGRLPQTDDPEFSIVINQIYVSKSHLKIKVGEKALVDTKQSPKTPLSFVFQSRATTRLNGKAYKLAAGEPDFELDSSSPDRIILGFKQSHVEIEIIWCPITIFIAGKEGHESTRFVQASLSQISEQGMDFNITTIIEYATHVVQIDEIPNIDVAYALSKGVPVYGINWVSNVKRNRRDPNNYLNDSLLSDPKESQKYLKYKVGIKRSQLFRDCVFMILASLELSLVNSIRELSGSVVMIEDNLYCNGSSLVKLLHERASQYEGKKIFIVSQSKDKILPADSRIYINDVPHVIESIVLNSIDCLRQYFTNSLGEASAPPAKDERIGRRRLKKIGKTDFFDLTSSTSLLQSSDGGNFGDPETAVDLRKRKRTSDNSKLVVASKRSTSNAHGEIKSYEKEQESTEECEFEIGDNITNKQGEENSGETLSFLDAVKLTKKKAVDSVRRELGIFDVSLNEELPKISLNLEQISDSLLKRSYKPLANENSTSYARPNFKTFKKITKQRNSKTSHVKLKLVLSQSVEITEKSVIHTGNPIEIDKLNNDFRDEMDEIQGYPVAHIDQGFRESEFIQKRREDTTSYNEELFVPQESQIESDHEQTEIQLIPSSVQSGLLGVEKSQNLKYTNINADYEDDEDDEDRVKFSFRRG